MEVFRIQVLRISSDVKTLYIASGRFARLCNFPLFDICTMQSIVPGPLHIADLMVLYCGFIHIVTYFSQEPRDGSKSTCKDAKRLNALSDAISRLESSC
jgi:hypothetical protein